MEKNVNEVLADELRKPVIKENILPADLAEMGPLSFFNGGVKYLLCVIDFFTKYA